MHHVYTQSEQAVVLWRSTLTGWVAEVVACRLQNRLKDGEHLFDVFRHVTSGRFVVHGVDGVEGDLEHAQSVRSQNL